MTKGNKYRWASKDDDNTMAKELKSSKLLPQLDSKLYLFEQNIYCIRYHLQTLFWRQGRT